MGGINLLNDNNTLLEEARIFFISKLPYAVPGTIQRFLVFTPNFFSLKTNPDWHVDTFSNMVSFFVEIFLQYFQFRIRMCIKRIRILPKIWIQIRIQTFSLTCLKFSVILCITTDELVQNSVLWIRNDLFRIRVQLWIFQVPDSCGSGSNPCKYI